MEISRHRIFKAFDLGAVTLRNRIIMPAMLTNFAPPEGFVTEGHKAFHAERSKGGVGMIIVEPAYVHIRGRFDTHQLAVCSNACLSGLRDLAGAIHDHGAAAAMQLHHGGKNTSSVLTGRQPLAPSPLPTPGLEMPVAATQADLNEIINAYSSAALLALEAGFDCVEISATTGGILGQFISRAWNIRNDDYGGSMENRTRLLAEVLRVVVGRVGDRMAVLCRFNSCEDPRIENGITLDESREVAKIVEAAGVHAVHVYVDFDGAPAPITDRPIAEAGLVDLAGEIKSAVNIPVIAVGRISPHKALEVIDSGMADLVAIGKALIADPEIPKKMKQNRLHEIRPCIVCLRCIDNVRVEKTIECTVNPRTGHETDPVGAQVSVKKSVLVVGGGPAGMTAALTAAEAGHDVSLCEKTKRLGGAMVLGTIFNPDLEDLLGYFNRKIRNSSIDLHLGTDLQDLLAAGRHFDAAIVATGGKPAGMDDQISQAGRKVISAYDALGLLDGRVPAGNGPIRTALWKIGGLFLKSFYHPGLLRFLLKIPFPVGRKLIILGDGFAAGELGISFAEAGRQVTILASAGEILSDMGPTAKAIFIAKLEKYGVRCLTGVKIKRVHTSTLRIECNGENEMILYDTVAIARPPLPDSGIHKAIVGRIPEVHVAGDCSNPGRIKEAIADGNRIGTAL